MSKYEAFSVHKIVVKDTDAGTAIERECDASWWVNTPNWARLYIIEGMRQELEEAVKQEDSSLPRGEGDESVVQGCER